MVKQLLQNSTRAGSRLKASVLEKILTQKLHRHISILTIRRSIARLRSSGVIPKAIPKTETQRKRDRIDHTLIENKKRILTKQEIAQQFEVSMESLDYLLDILVKQGSRPTNALQTVAAAVKYVKGSVEKYPNKHLPIESYATWWGVTENEAKEFCHLVLS